MAEIPCAVVARQREEPLYATASLVRNWLLLEQPGAWGRDALSESRLAGMAATELKARAARLGFRALLLRRTRVPSAGRRTCFLAHSGRARPWIEELALDDPLDLLDIDLAPLSEGRPLGVGAERTAPLYLVCTNGRHDPCCAELGRPVYRALALSQPESVWECSHIGGDRFAGNLVCLPHGLYFGRLDATEALRTVDRYERGLVDLDHYRGRAGDAYPVQAAEYLLRRERGIDGIHDVKPVGGPSSTATGVQVDFALAGGERWRVVIEVGRSEHGRPLTCTVPAEQRPPTYQLTSVDRV